MIENHEKETNSPAFDSSKLAKDKKDSSPITDDTGDNRNIFPYPTKISESSLPKSFPISVLSVVHFRAIVTLPMIWCKKRC